MRWIWLVLASVACEGTAGEDSGADPQDTQPQDTSPPEPDGTASLAVQVFDAVDAPVEEAGVRFCRGPLCLFADSDDEGRFGFENFAEEWHSLEVIPPMGTTGLATAFVPLGFQPETLRELTLTLPPLDAATTLTGTAQAAQIGAGLTMEIATGDLEPPTFVDPATEVAGVRLTEDQFVPVDDQDGSVVAQWFLQPFDHKAVGDIPLTFANDYSLPDGSELKVIVGDYTSSSWLDAGTLTVAAGELVGTVNLPVTSTVVLLDVTPPEEP